MKILIVGAGLTGATIARCLAEQGHDITVIDKRKHIGGNCYDEVRNGTLVHKYGPHLLHHSDLGVHNFLSRWTSWIPYEHKVKVEYRDTLISFPVNLKTLQELYGIETEQEAIKYFEKVRDTKSPTNCDELFDHSVGKDLADIFFRPYTKKMWGTDPKNIECAVGARIPVRTSDDDRYFSDKYQYMPEGGYTKMFERMLDHERIEVKIRTPFEKEMEAHYDFIFNSMPIDAYYDFKFGKLPYRSLRMEVKEEKHDHGITTVNNSASEEGHTRYTVWKNIPGHGDGDMVTYEYPCDYDGTNEPYYPVTHGKELYSKYAEHAKSDKMMFIGRMGAYQYIDMWKAVRNGLDIVSDFKA